MPSLSEKKTVPVRDIKRLLLKRIRMSGNLSGSDRYWELYMVDRFGGKRELIGAIPDWDQAEFIKQEIECFLSRVRSEQEEATTAPQGNAGQPAEILRPDLEAALATLEELDIRCEEPPNQEGREETDV